MLLVSLLSVLATASPVSPAVVGAVASPGTILVSGVNMKVSGVLSWTIFSGDRLDALITPALLTLNDSARLILLPKTVVRVEAGSSFKVIVLEGTVLASCERECRTAIEANDRLVAVIQKRPVRVARNGKAVTVTTDFLSLSFIVSSAWLLEMFPYQTGVHRPEDLPQADPY